MKQLFIKAVLLLLFLLLIDLLAGRLLYYLYSKSNNGIAFQEFYIVNKTTEDVLVLGSSRAAYHYVPEVIENEVGLKVYNAGREGTGKFFQYGVLLAIIDRYKPKKIILDFDYREIYKQGGFDRKDLDQLRPFYGRISGQFDALLADTWYKRLLYRFNLVKYNKKVFHILTGYVFEGRDNMNGFRPLYGKRMDPTGSLQTENMEVSSEKVEIIRSLLELALENNIDVVLVVSPYCKYVPENFMEPLENLAKEYDLPLLNFINDTTFLNRPYLFFNDELHLNETGALKFSGKVAHEILTSCTVDM
ncbi:MAG TPA: hypothetical protein PL069_11205 [Saprospiraceae bacterium]|nr:hypothetical protein [Saprospiraceae bacterium]